MATDLTIKLEDRPGTLANLTETIGKAGINLLGGCGIPCGGQGEVHLLVDDAAAVRRALQASGVAIQGEQPVLVTGVEDRPGGLGKVARKLADAGVNITLLYLTAKGQLVLGVDNMDKARSAL